MDHACTLAPLLRVRRRTSTMKSSTSYNRAFRPSRHQQIYLEAWLNPHAPKTISAICRHTGIPRRTVQDWLRSAAFVSWFNGALERHTDILWQPVLLKIAELALQGSIEHAKLLAQVRRGLRPFRGSGNAMTVIIGVPRPPDAARPDAG